MYLLLCHHCYLFLYPSRFSIATLVGSTFGKFLWRISLGQLWTLSIKLRSQSQSQSLLPNVRIPGEFLSSLIGCGLGVAARPPLPEGFDAGLEELPNVKRGHKLRYFFPGTTSITSVR